MFRLVVAIATALVAVAGVSPASAGSSTGFSFLDLPAGARAAALGGAGIAIAQGPTALFWNPAGIAPAPAADGSPARASGGRVEADHHESIQSFRQDVVGGVYERGGDAVGLGLNTHYTESIEGRDPLGNLTGSFGSTDLAIVGGYATTASKGLRLGGALQWTSETIAGQSASSFSIAAGGLYGLSGIPGLTLGASVRNLGSSPSFKTPLGEDGADVSLPMTVAAGAAYGGKVGSLPWLLAADVSKLKGDSAEGRLGLEVRPATPVALRLGWMLGQDEADLTAGAGIGVGMFDFDYAFVPYHDDLGSSHRIAVGARL